MIAKIFPTINNIAPYKSKVSTPYTEIYTYDTPYSVKSHGPSAYYFAYDSYSENPDFTLSNAKIRASEPFVKFYSGSSYPDQVSPYYTSSSQFAVYYLGYFIPETTSATFYLKGTGKARLQMSGGVDTGTVELDLSRSGVATIHVTGLSGPTQLVIKYISPDKSSQQINAFVVTWEDSTTLGQIPLAAGNYYNIGDYAVGISGVKLRSYNNILLDQNRGQVTKFSFEIPIVESTAVKGYKYVSGGDYFEDVNDSSKKIQKFRMVEFNCGYKYSDGSIATIQKFSGQVRGWTIKRSNSGDFAEIECYDWMSFLGDGINQGYPNIVDYLVADYMDPINVNGIAGDSKPRTYDGWELSKAIESVLYNGYIDPKIVKKKRSYIDVNDSIVSGYYLFHELNNENSIRLEKSFKYGNPLAVIKDNADAKYIWQFSVGSSLSDNLKKLMDNYGFIYGFNNKGYFNVTSIKNPIKTKSIDDFTYTGTWTEHIGPKMVYGVSKYNSTAGNKCVATFTGSNVRLIYNVGPAYGTVHVKVSNSVLGMVATVDVNTRATNNRNYYNGVDDSIGYNPCELVIGEGFNYGTYSLNFVCTGPTISINSVFVNDQSHFTSIDTIYSGDSISENGVLVDGYDLSSSVDDIRNDVVVVGRLKGVESYLSLGEGAEQVFNPNNPVSNHVLARAIDRVSIGSLSSSNYTGRKLQTIIIDPNIATEERAAWLATETVKRYNTYNKSLSPVVNIIGNPLYDIGDRITVKDIKIDAFPTIRSFWLEGTQEKWESGGKYTSKLTMASFEPWSSYYRYPTPSLSRFNQNVFINPKYFNFGLPIDFNKGFPYLHSGAPNLTSPGTLIYMYRSYNSSATLSYMDRLIPEFGYTKIHNEVIEYHTKSVEIEEEFSDSTLYKISLKVYKRGLYNTATISDLAPYVNKAVELQYNPYMSEDFGLSPSVSFDLINSGFVRVGVYSSTGDKVDVLTGNKTDSSEGWAYLEPGTYFYNWGCLDRYGQYNEANTGFFQRSGSKDYDFPYLGVSNLGEWYPYFGAVSDTASQYKVGADRYVMNRSRTKYGQFYLSVQYRNRDGGVKGIKAIDGSPSIYTVLRITGNSILTVSETDGIHEEFRVVPSDSELDNTTLSTLWYSNTLSRNVVSSIRPLTATATYRRYYTGIENDGLGVKFVLKNQHAKNRIVDIEVKRYIFTFLRNYREEATINSAGGYSSYALGAVIEMVDRIADTVIESGGFTWKVNKENGVDVFIKQPEISFISPALGAKLDYYLYDAGKSIGGNFYKDKVISLSVSHLHCFQIITTDFSGQRQGFNRSLWWVAPNFHNTEVNFSGGNPKKPYNGITSAEKIVFSGRGHHYNRHYHSLGGLPSGVYPSVVVDWDSDNKNVVMTEGIYGVLIHGDYL